MYYVLVFLRSAMHSAFTQIKFKKKTFKTEIFMYCTNQRSNRVFEQSANYN